MVRDLGRGGIQRMKEYRKLLPVFICIIILFIFIFQAGAADFPVTITDYLSGEVILQDRPQRIISLAPSVTEMLFAIGLEEKVVGVTTFADYPPSALRKEKIGSITEINIEKIVKLEPDLVIAAPINKMSAINKLKDIGIKVVGFKPRTINDTITVLKKLGKITGQREETRKIVTEMYIQLAEIKNMVEDHLKNHSRPKVFYEIWNNPLTTVGEDTFIDNMIKLAGGINIGAKANGAWPQYSLEKLLLENPGVYISSPHSAPHRVSVGAVKNRDEFRTIKAIKNNRIYIVDQDIISRASPRIVKGLKILVKAIFPELTTDIEKLPPVIKNSTDVGNS